MYKLIVIQGNIASGKSTLLNTIKRICGKDFQYLGEPVEKYFNNGVLDDYYSGKINPSEFQQRIITERFESLKKLDPKIPVITERWVEDDFIFAQQLLENCEKKVEGDFQICPLEWKEYDNHFANEHKKFEDYWLKSKHFDKDVEGFPIKRVLTIYMNDSAENCFKRVNIRQRIGEHRITLDYMKGLTEKFDQLVTKFKNVFTMTINSDIMRTREYLGKIYSSI
jgi:deoxyadenosine/deoxycytidine kinase